MHTYKNNIIHTQKVCKTSASYIAVNYMNTSDSPKTEK